MKGKIAPSQFTGWRELWCEICELKSELSAIREDAESALDAFVELWSKRYRQHDPDWYGLLKITLGGSDLAAAMSESPYKTFEDVVASKLGFSSWDGGSVACWWGTMFEDVAGRLIELDLACILKGANICVQAIPGHRNSPDGYVVLQLVWDGESWSLWFSDDSRAPSACATAMIEIKCPYRRLPDGKIPRHYKAQPQSGLFVSPVANFSLFVDTLIRKCSLEDLGPSIKYDYTYHRYDTPKRVGTDSPYAWGLTAVYAPRPDAPLGVRVPGAKECDDGDDSIEEEGEEGCVTDAAQEAWSMHGRFFRTPCRWPAIDLIDFGEADAQMFDHAMYLIDGGRFKTRHADACFGDGRAAGSDLHSGPAIGRQIEELRAAAPEHYWMIGVIPWKIVKVHYIPVFRTEGFPEKLKNTLAAVNDCVLAARASGDPAAYMASLTDGKNAAKAARREERSGPRFSEGEIQDIFDSLG